MNLTTIKRDLWAAFAEGMAQVVMPVLPSPPTTNGFAVDRESLSRDWRAVGNDLWTTLEKEPEEHEPACR